MSGLYLHIPFCRKKCHYCDFFSAPPEGNQLANWHLLLQRNLQLIAKKHPPRIETIFFGGGTPSLLSPAQIDKILNCCRNLLPLSPDLEISLEANPGTLNAESLDGYLAAGINRLSLGIQSFDDKSLQRLGRRHNARDAIQSLETARSAGFTNISVDLIFALPGQTIGAIEEEVAQLITLAPDHIGIYGLTIEAGTTMEQLVNSGELLETDEDLYAESYLLLDRQLTAAGFEHYEISNFAQPGFRCKHNLAYWQRKTCLAAGAGAHGFDANGYGRRYAIPADLSHYSEQLDICQDPARSLEKFNRQQAMAETLYLALRTSYGVDGNTFTQNFGISPEDAFPDAFKSLATQLKRKNGRWFFTPEDWLLYDHLISHFL